MYLPSILGSISTLVATALADQNGICLDPFHSRPNWCGHFTNYSNADRMGCLYANKKCENFDWPFPGDERPEQEKGLPVRLIGSWNCGLCFVFEEKDCQAKLTRMLGQNEIPEGYPTEVIPILGYPMINTTDSLSYFCESPGWYLELSQVECDWWAS
ncbi:uncharacterized protein CC84DRAFT_1218678 [Paraphaeosphaeria sporulosa]|uniref:Uncharacterized protein n=1 Tax=Paraphaeosphaeria sporulosa TaxID=1460663 RepID=A0A177CDK7_9PLEO|nr:uncharacterized protein CC84DRAFT_1218678 [Paraphaeosphaeria sporulosa]OAG05321.1 hypothetical protein CC84DRAFT_1218678 [Paraphaeosphaeria sporulosa]